MKNIFCLFEGHFKIPKNGVFLFQISFFVLEILTKLDSTSKDNEVHLPGYDVVRKDRENNGDMVVVSVFTFELISIFKSVLTSARVILNALLLRSRDPDQSRSLCLLGTDRHSGSYFG